MSPLAHFSLSLALILNQDLCLEAQSSLLFPASGSLQIACPLIGPKQKVGALLIKLEQTEALLFGEEGEHL